MEEKMKEERWWRKIKDEGRKMMKHEKKMEDKKIKKKNDEGRIKGEGRKMMEHE